MKYQYGGPLGDKIDFSSLFANPLLSGFTQNANAFSDKYSAALAPSMTSSILGAGPGAKMSKSEYLTSIGWNPRDPLNFLKKGYTKLEGQYKDYTNKYNTDSQAYNTASTNLAGNIPGLLSGMSMLMQGMKGQQNYNLSQANQPSMIETPGFQEGGDVNEMMQQDPFLKARAQIESSGVQDSTSSAGAKGMFQITPIALKEYNRKYDSKYTWDQIVQNPTANAHVSQGLIKDIKGMINKVDTNLSDFDKNVLAEMAYNYGPYRFLDKLKAKGKNVTLQDMINDNSLPRETRNHGQKFINYFDKQKEIPQYQPQQIDKTRVEPQKKYTDDQIKKFTGDPYEYLKKGDSYMYRKSESEEFKPINDAGRRELQRRKFQFGGIANVMDSLSTAFQLPMNNMIPDSVYDMALDPKKHFIATEADPSLLRSGIRRVYSKKDNTQIGFINKEGQFMPLTKDGTMVRFEGRPSGFNPSVSTLLAQKQMGGRIFPNTPRQPMDLVVSPMQNGGNINNTGYTPGTPTMNNDHNIIPSPNITMEKTPFPVNAFPMNKNGQLIGRPVTMKPGVNYYFPGAASVLEIPQKQDGGIIRRKGDPWSYRKNADGSYTTWDSTRGNKEFTVKPGDRAFDSIDAIFPHIQQAALKDMPSSASNPYADNDIPKQEVLPYNPGNPSNENKQFLPYSPLSGVNQQYYNQEQTTNTPNPSAWEMMSKGISSTYGVDPNISKSDYAKNLGLDLAGLALPGVGKLVGKAAIMAAESGSLSRIPKVLEGLVNLFKGRKPINDYSTLFNAEKEIPSAISNSTRASNSTNYNELFGDYYNPNVSTQMTKKIAKKVTNKAINKALQYGPQYFKYGGISRLRYQMGDEVEQQHNPQEEQQEQQGSNIIPIQTEIGEKFLHPDLSISNVAAKKLHKNMDNDEVTDLVQEGTFVGSRDPQMRISKKEAEQFIMGTHAMKYEQGKAGKLPKDIKFSDIFSKRYHTPAELLSKINNKFKILDKPGDIFVRSANEENLASRQAYGDIIKYLTEAKKPAEVGIFKYGGSVKKMQSGGSTGGGGLLSSILGVIPQIFTAINGTTNTNKTLKDIDKYQTQNQGYLQSQLQNNQLANLLGFASQDNTPEMYNPQQALDEVSNPYQKAIGNIPLRQQVNTGMARGAASDAYSRLVNIDPRMAYASASTIGANAYKQANQANDNLLQYRDQLSTTLGQHRSGLVRESLLNRQRTLADARSNRNQLNAGFFGNQGQIGNDYYSGLAGINNTALTAKMGARGQYANFLSNMSYGLSNSLGNLGQSISNLGRPVNTAPYGNPNIPSGGNYGVPSYTPTGQQFVPGSNLTGSYKWPG